MQVALERLLEGRYVKGGGRYVEPQPFPDGKTFGDLTKDICGKYEGPSDLSYNPKYMEGFGED